MISCQFSQYTIHCTALHAEHLTLHSTSCSTPYTSQHCTHHILHCTKHSGAHSILHNTAQSTLYTAQHRAHYTQHSTEHTIRNTARRPHTPLLYTVLLCEHDIEQIVHNTLYNVQCTVHTVQCTLFSAYCTVHTVQCALYGAHCTVHTAQCALYSAHCTVHSTWKFTALDFASLCSRCAAH